MGGDICAERLNIIEKRNRKFVNPKNLVYRSKLKERGPGNYKGLVEKEGLIRTKKPLREVLAVRKKKNKVKRLRGDAGKRSSGRLIGGGRAIRFSIRARSSGKILSIGDRKGWAM